MEGIIIAVFILFGLYDLLTAKISLSFWLPLLVVVGAVHLAPISQTAALLIVVGYIALYKVGAYFIELGRKE